MAQALARQLPKQFSQLKTQAATEQVAAPVQAQAMPVAPVNPAADQATAPLAFGAFPDEPQQQAPVPGASGDDTRPVLRQPEDRPLGAAGKSRDRRKPAPEDADFMVIQDRWRVGVPEDPRFTKGSIFNPYRQNVLKGDYPIIGNDIFMNFDMILEGTADLRQLVVGQAVSSANPNSFEFFGRGRQESVQGIMVFSFDMFKGDASFKPVDWRFKVEGVGDFNYLNARENQVISPDVRQSQSRQKNFVSAEQIFMEKRLGDTTKIFPFLRGKGSQGGRSPEFDTTSIRVGVQEFTSDFRGFIFSDSNLGARLFGNIGSNRWQYNLAYFNMLEKNTNSNLNQVTFNGSHFFRNQNVYIANVFRQDTFVPGYTMQASVHFSDQRPSYFMDDNGFVVRPAPIGFQVQNRVRAGYFGLAGDGHFGRYNITHAFYQAVGRDSYNPIAQRATSINAQMAAAEFSVDFDYVRYRIAAFYTSGDHKPQDGTARGFDAIVDNPNFAGGRFSFFDTEGLRIASTPLGLKDERSLIPSLRTTFQGQSNFVNPGLTLYNTGLDFDITPKLRGFVNYNLIRFNAPETLTYFLNRAGIGRGFGNDYGIGFIYRPLLNENIVLTGGASTLRGGKGFNRLFTSNCDGTPAGCGASQPTLFSTFLTARFVY
ncbi:MAG: hypothetical protein J2P41_06425 [Blastocatellia bacterium]|nr:hypothetical protein [Blastocatellia bacterium]